MIRGLKALVPLLAVLAAAWAGSGAADAAGPAHARPGSALFYPVYEAEDDSTTVITVTNTNSSRLSCGNNNRKGDVLAHFTYYDSLECREQDKGEFLTPGDTITLLTGDHVADPTVGWLWVEAWDPETMEAIDYDFLIGSAIIVKAGRATDYLFSYTPFSFRALRTTGDKSDCDFYFTDIANFGFADFNGNEYETFPEIAYIDNFFAEIPNAFSNRFYLMVPDGVGGDDTFELALRIWNNNEQQFSQTDAIGCWLGAIPLSEITQQVLATRIGGDPEELVDPVTGDPILTGWIEIKVRDFDDSDTHGVLGVYTHLLGPSEDFAAGHEMQFAGEAEIYVSLRRFEF